MTLSELKKRWKRHYIKIVTSVIIAILIFLVAYLEFLSPVRDFFVLYRYYFLMGIAILVVILFLINFYKPLLKFLKE